MADQDSFNRFDTLSDDPSVQPRLPPRNRTSLGSEHQAIHDSIVTSVRNVSEMSNGALPGPFNAWMFVSPTLTQALDSIGVAIRTQTPEVPKVLKEVAVCVVAAHYQCNVAFWAHSGIALKAGLSQRTIDDLKHQKRPEFEDVPGVSASAQRTVYDFTSAYVHHHRVDDSLYESVREILSSDAAMVQLVLVIGHYCNISAQLNLLRVPAPGETQPFPQD